MQLIWLFIGLLCTGLGLVGLALPLLPTTPFLLLAAFCFAKSSERLHGWLLSHRVFGPMIIDWQERGAIRPMAKKLATVSIVLTLVLSWGLGVPGIVIGIQAVTLLGVTVFLWTRPSA